MRWHTHAMRWMTKPRLTRHAWWRSAGGHARWKAMVGRRSPRESRRWHVWVPLTRRWAAVHNKFTRGEVSSKSSSSSVEVAWHTQPLDVHLHTKHTSWDIREAGIGEAFLEGRHVEGRRARLLEGPGHHHLLFASSHRALAQQPHLQPLHKLLST